jgi:hypothetical protein
MSIHDDGSLFALPPQAGNSDAQMAYTHWAGKAAEKA